MLSKEDCEKLIKFFKKKPKKNFHKHETEDNTYNIVLELNTEKYFFKHFDKLIKDLNYIARLEQAIAKKYGEETVQNPRSTWTQEKEQKYLKIFKIY